MLSRTVTYALRTLGYLVENRGGRIRGEEIAQAVSVPANYLSKILNQLRKQGIVDSEKGWGGGFELREEALDLPIRRIQEIFDGVDGARETACVFGLPKCDADHPCPLHPYWEQVKVTLDEMLTTTTVRGLRQDQR